MNRISLSRRSTRARLSRGLPLMAAAGALGLATSALAKTEQIWLDVASVLGNPVIQAQIVACVGEQVFFTGRVHIVMKDDVIAHINWGNMVGETADGDVFHGGSAVGDQVQTLTLTEVGAGPNNRHFKTHAVGGELTITCQT